MTDDECTVCRDPMDHNRANCHHCGTDFHLALRIDQNARDCGDAWIDDDVQALVFGCNLCLGKVASEARPRRYARRSGVGANAVARARRSEARPK